MKNLLLLIITFFTLNISAQEKTINIKQSQEESLANIETKKLTKQLNLSSEQEKKIYDVMLQHFKEKLKSKQELKKVVASKEKVKKTEIKKAIVKQKQGNSEKLNNQLKEILTEEQYKSYLETHLKQQKAKQKIRVRKN